jgi:hypothetical protein
MIDYNNWKDKIYSAIETLSDVTFQEEIWSGRSKKYFSSFEEDIMILNDDNCFKEEFWVESHLSSFNLSETTLNLLRDFKSSLELYLKDYYLKDNKPDYLDIINDPEWIKITNKAKVITANWR